MTLTFEEGLGGLAAGANDAALGLRSCSFTAAIFAASAADSPLATLGPAGSLGTLGTGEIPLGTNSAAVGFREPLLRAVFIPGACAIRALSKEGLR